MLSLIQHYPSGLFPHIKSGFEREPFLPEAGKQVILGCRMENPAFQVTLSYSFNGEKQPDIKGTFAWDNEQWTYTTFTVTLPDKPCHMEYLFEAENGSRSESFTVESVSINDILIGKQEDERFLLLSQSLNNVSVSFFDSLSVKVNDEYLKESSIRSNINKSSTELAWLAPRIRVWQDQNGKTYQAELNFTLRGSALYGFGEKFDRVNQAGLSPLSYVVEQFSDQQDKSYIPIPFFFTEAGVGFLLHGTWKTRFVTKQNENGFIDIQVLTECPQDGILFEAELFTGTPPELIQKYTEKTGKPALPPKWAFGPWMSSNGWNTQKEALEQIERMNELDIPATVMVLEAWSDEETFYIWNDAKYETRTDGSAFRYEDFTFPADGKWPDPKGLVKELDNNGIKLVLWQIPVIKNDVLQNHTQLEADIKYAIDNNLCVLQKNGMPYRITEMWFGGSMIPDFTNPDTYRWWFDKRRYLIEELGVAGFKTDGGEFLFDRDSVLYDGRTIAEAHNDYPNLYIGAYNRFMNETMGKGKGVTFSRAGYTGAQKFPVHWAGDQISTFSELRGQLTAGLSLGLSGVLFWSFDLGGFAGDFPTTELYLRSAAFAAFSPIMQFHSEPRYGQYYMTERQHFNNDRSPWNMAKANCDDRIIPIYRKFAKLRMCILPYLWEEAQYCVKNSRPMMAHLIYDFHNDHRVLFIEDEYMLGRDLLVAPIVSEGATGRTVFMPEGEWFDFWSGELVQGGEEYYIECGLDSIPVYSRKENLTRIDWEAKV